MFSIVDYFIRSKPNLFFWVIFKGMNFKHLYTMTKSSSIFLSKISLLCCLHFLGNYFFDCLPLYFYSNDFGPSKYSSYFDEDTFTKIRWPDYSWFSFIVSLRLILSRSDLNLMHNIWTICLKIFKISIILITQQVQIINACYLTSSFWYWLSLSIKTIYAVFLLSERIPLVVG